MPTPVDVASSKVRILEAPVLAPGTCMLCGASRNDDRGYIDMGKDIQFVGVIYFCTFCMTEVANAIGCLMPEQSLALENELDAARQRILEFETKDRTLNEAINSLRATGLFSGTDFSVVADPRAAYVAAQSETDDGTNSGNKLQSSSDVKESEQSNSEQGSDDVSTTRSDESEYQFKL